jgi:hypothetical protein
MLVTLLASTGGLIPTAPTVGTAVATNVAATVAFTASSYIGKGTITYTATSTPGNLTGTEPLSPITILGLTNGTPYTFTIVGVTDYGVSSEASAVSNSVTPVAPPPPTPTPTPTPGPPPAPCQPPPWPQNCSFVSYSCDGTTRYDYYDCGGAQTCPGSGGYYPVQVEGYCGYIPTPTPPPVPPPPACPDCNGIDGSTIGPCCGTCVGIKAPYLSCI